MARLLEPRRVDGVLMSDVPVPALYAREDVLELLDFEGHPQMEQHGGPSTREEVLSAIEKDMRRLGHPFDAGMEFARRLVVAARQTQGTPADELIERLMG